MRVVNDDIDKCDSKDQLKKELKAATSLLMSYQNIIDALVREQLHKDLTDFGFNIENKES